MTPLSPQTLLQDARTAYVFPAAELESLIGGSSVTLPASTNIGAGTAVSLDGNGNAVQTWGPAIGATVELISGSANSAMPSNVGVCKLSAVDFVALVSSGGSGAESSFSLVAGAVSGATISVGTPATPPTDILSLIPLTASTFVGLDNAGNAYFCGVAGGVITIGGAVSTGLASVYATGALSSSSFVAVDSTGKAAIGTISGSAITMGATVTVGSGNFSNGAVQIEALSASAFVAVFGDGANSDVLTAIVGSVAGTGVTFGTAATLIGTSVGLISQPGVLSPTSFAVGYCGGTLGGPGYGVAATVSGSTVTFGTPARISNMTAQSTLNNFSSNNNIPLAVIDNAHVAFGFSFVLPQVCTVSGATLTAPAAIPLPQKGVINAVVPVGSNLMVVDITPNIYEVDASSNVSPYLEQAAFWNYGLSPIDATRALAWFLNFNGDLQACVVTYQPISAGPIAFASEAVSAGQNGNFTLSGVTGGFSGLTPGAKYFVNGDGTLTTTNTGHLAGIALPNNQLLARAA